MLKLHASPKSAKSQRAKINPVTDHVHLSIRSRTGRALTKDADYDFGD
jgi:hypothetical protein